MQTFMPPRAPHLQHRQAQLRCILVMDQVDCVATPALHLALAQEEGVRAPAPGTACVACGDGVELEYCCEAGPSCPCS